MNWQILEGDALTRLRELPDESVHCCVTSPPYWGLRDYGVSGQLGLEKTPEEYVAKMVEVFREVRRVLRKDGTLWLNIGDSYANDGKWGGSTGGKHVSALHGNAGGLGRGKRETGLKPKDLVGIPWALAFALRADGWVLRQEIIWAKPNPMPESVRDRCTKAHEYIFLLTKSARYWYDTEAIAEPYSTDDGSTSVICGFRETPPSNGDHSARTKTRNTFYQNGGRNKRSVWEMTTQPFREAHFATFPPELPRTCILAGCPEEGTVLDPFAGAGTTGLVAVHLRRNFLGIELNPAYCEMASRRIESSAPLFFSGASSAKEQVSGYGTRDMFPVEDSTNKKGDRLD